MSRRVRIKMCGMTRAEDAASAVAIGADALGFVFWHKSPRMLTFDAAREIARHVPAFIPRVGVFVNAAVDEIGDVVDHVELTAAQLHGTESVEAFEALGVPRIKAVTLSSRASVDEAAALPAHVLVLVDAIDTVRLGGTGTLADWTLAASLAARRPIVLAGGLNAENVGDAIASVKPWGVDVSSGIERSPGIKDADRMRAFVAAVRAAEGRLS
jgi:phosphoribosylanthranilate isomerase